MRRCAVLCGVGGGGEYLLGAGKSFDLFTHDINAAVVGGIQLEDHLTQILRAIDLAGESKDSGSFTGARGTVEEEVRESFMLNETVDGRKDVLVPGNILQCVRAI